MKHTFAAGMMAVLMVINCGCSKNNDGGKQEKKDVVPQMVDLGLSVKWAEFNLGASKEDEYGDYYQWGGTAVVTDMSIMLDWENCPYHSGKDEKAGWTKYNNNPAYGTADNKVVLQVEDDAAYCRLGGNWHTPTESEWMELKNNCGWSYTENYKNTGAKGWIVTSRKTGYTDKYIFLPAAGCRVSKGDVARGEFGYYWSSTLDLSNPSSARQFSFTTTNVSSMQNNRRYVGTPIRPVAK